MKAFACVMALASAAQAAVVAPLTAGLPLTYGLGAPLTYAAPALAGTPVTYAAPTIAAPAVAAPAVAAPAVYAVAAPQIASSQYQQQDELGNLAYGYSNINSAKQEAGNTYGGVTGSYSYVDANGIRQTTNYIADGLGFRVQATNLPVAPVANLAQPEHTLVGPAPVGKTPEVLAAEQDFFAAFEEAASRTKRSVVLPAATAPLAYSPYNYGLPLAAAPLNYGLAPVAYAAPAAAPAITAAPAVGGVEGTLTKIQLTPGHAVAYRVD